MTKQSPRITGMTVAGIILYVLLGLAQIIVCVNPANTFQYCGMAVDSQGRLYLGEKLWIGIYEDGAQVDKIVIKERYYEFTIIDDQLHKWSSSGGRYDSHVVYSLDGVRLDSYRADNLSYKERFEYTTEDGCRYVMKNHHRGRTKVICYYPDGGEEVVFRMPLAPYLVQFTMPLYIAGIVLWLVRAKRPGKLNVQTLKQYWRPEKYGK